MIDKIKKILFSKETPVFILFLLLSTFLWFTQTLNQKRISTIKIPINYKGIPNEIKLIKDVPKEISIRVKDEGITLLEYYQQKNIPLNIDLKRTYYDKGEIIISRQELKSHITKHLRPTTSILSIRPDSILLEYSKLSTKTFSIQLDTNITLAPQYIFSKKIELEPNKVKVYGANTALEELDSIFTETIKIEDLKDTVELKVKLKKSADIKYKTKEVKVKLFVEKFTERKIELPIRIVSNKGNKNIKLFPPKLQVSYNIGMSNYYNVNDSDLVLVFDLEKAKASQSKFYKPEVIIKSPYISNVNISPAQIEFLIVE